MTRPLDPARAYVMDLLNAEAARQRAWAQMFASAGFRTRAREEMRRAEALAETARMLRESEREEAA